MPASGGGLYDWRCKPIGKAPPFYGPGGLPLSCMLIGQVLCLAEEPAAPGMARIWVLPVDGAPRRMPKRILGEMVAALDHDMAVAILGSHVDAVAEAAAAVLQMVEGGHA